MKPLQLWIGMLAVSLSLMTGCQKEKTDKNTYRMTGIEQLDSGDYAAAVSSFDLALGKSGSRVGRFQLDVLKYRAEAEYQLEDYEAAAHTYDILLQVDKEEPEYLYLKSMAEAGQGKYKEAMDDFTQAYSLDSKAKIMEKAMIMLTSALENDGQYRQAAMSIYEQVLADGLSNAQVYNRIGLYYLEEKKYEDALSYFSQGLMLGDETVNSELLYNQAAVYEYQGEYAKALEALESYADTYGADDNVTKEIAFLKTR